MHKKKLIVDFDDTIVYSIFLNKVNNFLKTSYTYDYFKDYYIDGIIPEDRKHIFYETFCNENPYENACMIDGAVEALKKLSEKYDIYICSGCLLRMSQYSAKMFSYKYDFLIQNFPFLDPRKFIFTSSKEVICGDVIIDDLVTNLKGSFKKKLLFSSYHNKNISQNELEKLKILRVDSWKDICDLLL